MTLSTASLLHLFPPPFLFLSSPSLSCPLFLPVYHHLPSPLFCPLLPVCHLSFSFILLFCLFVCSSPTRFFTLVPFFCSSSFSSFLSLAHVKCWRTVSWRFAGCLFLAANSFLSSSSSFCCLPEVVFRFSGFWLTSHGWVPRFSVAWVSIVLAGTGWFLWCFRFWFEPCIFALVFPSSLLLPLFLALAPCFLLFAPAFWLLLTPSALVTFACAFKAKKKVWRIIHTFCHTYCHT